MATYVVNAVQGGLGNAFTLAENDRLIIGQSAVLYSTDTIAVLSAANTNYVYVAGVVSSDTNDGLQLFGAGPSSSYRIVVAATGYIQAGDDGISVNRGTVNVMNNGTISGSWGMYLGGGGQMEVTIVNTGTIRGTQAGISITEGAATANFATLFNSGTIVGGTSFHGGFGNDTVENSGLMRGEIALGSGSDKYDGTGGRVIGTIFGGAGTDSFVVGNYREVIDGGSEIDTLNFRDTAGLRVALDGSFANTGIATGDTYSNIEAILGSATGADMFTGDAQNNNLYGLGGADSLSGGAGSDSIVGGSGKDVLAGGLGIDHFVYTGLWEAGDLISDFTNSGANNDDFQIKGAAFGALPVGAIASGQFVSRADNLAQDADDRFIFRTTDKTLWFDSNGNGAGGLTMLADLQASATMSYLDITII